MDYKIVYDTTPAVEASIDEIVKTFVEAVILVTLVVFIFLQNFRATIIPLLTVPVSLIGTFIFFPLLGFSVNTLSMFGLVLAIGIVVDDAIVVVEAVMHHIEHGLDPEEATLQAMKEVSAPVIGIALILSAVFVPVAFVGGLTGQMYQQFALTIAISVLLSAFSALSLSPALAAMLLKPAKPMRGPARRLLPRLQQGLRPGHHGLRRGRADPRAAGVLTILLVGVVVLGAGLFGRQLPAGFIPDEDQGILGVNVQLPPGASLERTRAVLTQVEEIVAKTEGVDSFPTIGGYGLVTNTLPAELRHDLRAPQALGRAPRRRRCTCAGSWRRFQREFARIPEAIIFPFNIPTISGFGASAGFKFLLQDRSGTLSVEELGAQTRKFLTPRASGRSSATSSPRSTRTIPR